MDVGVGRARREELAARHVGALREEHRNRLLVAAAVGAQRSAKGGQIVVGRALPGQIVKAGKWDRRYPVPDGVAVRLSTARP